MQVAANFANDNKFILIANIFLITLVLKCLLRCQSSALIYMLCGKTLSYQSSLVAAAESDFTFLVTQLGRAPFVQGQREAVPNSSSRIHGFPLPLREKSYFKGFGYMDKGD